MMSIARSVVFLVLVVGVVGCDQPEAGGKKAAGKQAPAKQGLPPEAAPPTQPPAPADPPPPVIPSPPPTEPVPPADAAPPADVAPPAHAAPPTEPAAPAGWTPPANPTDLRGDEVIPPGTPAPHVKAFKKLALAKDDGAPVGGIGANGVHLDKLELGAGWESSRCADPTTTFTIGSNDRVNVCMRIVHPRGTSEELSIDWVKNGKNARRSKVAVSDMHAYLTRGYLPISDGYAGEWKAVIKSADGTVLGEVAFTVK